MVIGVNPITMYLFSTMDELNRIKYQSNLSNMQLLLAEMKILVNDEKYNAITDKVIELIDELRKIVGDEPIDLRDYYDFMVEYLD